MTDEPTMLTPEMLRDPRTITMMVLRGLDGSEMPYSESRRLRPGLLLVTPRSLGS